MDSYRKHWAKPKHNFKAGDPVRKDELVGVVLEDRPYSGWIKVQWTSGIYADMNPFIVFHGDLTLEPENCKA